jgi:hypothetical protein
MMSWDYLPLTLAAKELGCTEDYLKHLAANRNARIHVLTGGRAHWFDLDFDENDKLAKVMKASPKICLVPFEFWARREAGADCKLNSLTSVDSKNMPDGIGDVLYSAPWYDCTGKTIEFTKFVILRDELERLKLVTQTGPTQAEAVENKFASSQKVTELASSNIIQGNTGSGEQKLSKLQKQQNAILDVIRSKKIKPMAIPDGEKGTIQLICESDYSNVFSGTTSFDRAWKKGIGRFWQMEHHESYARRGNN